MGTAIFIAWAVLFGLLLGTGRARANRRQDELQALAAALPEGRVVDGELCARLEGRELWLRVAGRGKRRRQELHLRVENAAELLLDEADGLELLGRWLGVADALSAPAADDLVVRAGSPAEASRLLADPTGRLALRALLDRGEFSGIQLRGGWLSISRRRERLDPEYVLWTAARLAEVARALDRREVQVVVRGERRFAWTGGGDQVRCPYCRDGLDPAGDAAQACGACGTAHHRECLAEGGGGSLFACAGRGRERVRG